MKILHLITSLKIGGAESALVNFLHQKKHTHIVVYFYHGPHAHNLEKMGIEIHKIAGLISYADPIALILLARLIKKIKPDVIHSALWSANIIGRIMAHIFNIPIICDIHGNSFDEGKIRNLIDRATVKYATYIVAVSKSAHDAYYENIIGRSALYPGGLQEGLSSEATWAKDGTPCSNINKLLTIKNGIDNEAVRAAALEKPLSRAQFRLKETDFVVGAIGRLEPIKSYDILIRAFGDIALRGACAPAPQGDRCKDEVFAKTKEGSTLPARPECFAQQNVSKGNIKLIIIGGGSQEAALKKLTISLGIENNVIFIGERTDAIKFYPLFDCFALSSQSEGLSISLLEALCFNLPIITTNKNPTHDVITHGVHGLLVQPNNTPALTQALVKIIQNPSLRTFMQQNNQILIEKDFSLTKNRQAYYALYALGIEQHKKK